jgi:hypothetical protein
MCISTTLSGSQPQPISTLSGNQFDDLDAFAQAIKPLNITVNQLTPGSFLGTVKFADFGHLKFTYVNQNQTFQAIGPKSPDHLAFAIAQQADRTPIINESAGVPTLSEA